MRLVLVFAAFVSVVASTEWTQQPFSCDPADQKTKSLGFCQTNLSISARAADLVSRFTLDEKIAQLVSSAPAIPRLSIPAYQWWSEALHGVAYSRGTPLNGTITTATSFPQVILAAASFNEHLWYRIGQVIGVEARAIYNAGESRGLTLWAPNINIFRDPRWGRGQETPGEDPTVTGKYAVAFVRGVQGDTFLGGKKNLNHLQASACCKHFTAYDMENWHGNYRYGFNAIVTKQDLADTYQPPFKKCIQEARASGLMCGYNSVNGIPSCADHNLLTIVARHQWGFQGYIASDCDAVKNVFRDHNYTKTEEETVADVLHAGMDVNCGSFLSTYTRSAVDKGIVSESTIDRALHNLFSIRIRLGLFNGSPKNLPYGNISRDKICSLEHQKLALEVAK
ncbi:unnamed protein product [Cuscuta epithymum]|uniref:Glycoside hydrolase family 3 N-terminal domain-containing protein n=1 Tax=Cuscuta epithymum TaxID=186058 RepID=A0AAV0E5J5_9ASTE|nr:unnamed protein product [Cuscuta epithymum]CAH9144160.1 unnamed protein product [Cuscuta epithymum]